MTRLERQVEELVLLRCSLLPSEILEFASPSSDDCEAWARIVEAGGKGNSVPDPTPCPAQFNVKLEGAPLWFEFTLHNEYPSEPSSFETLVRGYGISRAEQQRWQSTVQQQRSLLLDDIDFPVFELISGYLFPLLHAEFDPQPRPSTEKPPLDAPSEPPTYAHALLTSHHLKSPQKRRSLQRWSSELRLRGFAKVGHPGIIYCAGGQADVAEFVNRVKGMQWLALRVRFEEPLSGQRAEDNAHGSWLELQKVGEVVEEMKKLGRERSLSSLGIGSGSG